LKFLIPKNMKNIKDFGGWNGSGAATTATSSTVSNGLRLGATSDTEVSVTPNAAANADGADEDGVSLPSRLIAGSMASLYAQFTNTTASNAFISAWVDFNRNGSFADADEQVVANLSATAGVTDGAGALASGSIVVSAAISTAGYLSKNDAEITTLSGANTYVPF
jgi:hypothetical protein